MASSAGRKGGTLGNVAPLTAAQRRALAGLKRSGVLDGVYLAGGVAVAEHLRHRTSNDLDFFSLTIDLDLEDVRRRVAILLTAPWSLRATSRSSSRSPAQWWTSS